MARSTASSETKGRHTLVRRHTTKATASCLSVGLLLAVSACGGGHQSGSAKTITGKFALQQAATTATGRSAVQFADLVSKYTNGSVKITVYPGSQLGTAVAMLQGAEAGTISFYASPTLNSVVPDTDALEMPYIFPSEEVASKVLNGPALTKSLWSKFESHNLSYLGAWTIGFADILTRNRKVTEPTDLKGLRIRVFEPVVSTKLYASLSADAVTLDSKEVVTALSTHLIDGADDPPSTMAANNWYNGMHYLADTNQVFVSAPVLVSKSFMKKLNPSQQAAVKRAMKETIAPNMADADKTNDAAVEKMRQGGVTVTHPDVDKFKTATNGVIDQIREKYPDVVDAMRNAVSTSG